MSEPVPASLLSALDDLVRWLDTAQVSATVIGGVAASILGRPRLTQDIDALVIMPEASWSSVLTTAQNFGIVARIADVLDFAHRSRVLLLRHEKSGIDIDITIGGLQFEQTVVEQSKLYDIGGIQLRLPRVEDLLIMKATACRPKDLQDIEGLLDTHPNANVAAVTHWVREFATAVTMPDMLDEWEKLLARREK